MSIDTYLHFSGQCKEAFQFYEKVLGGKIELSMTYGESPAGAETSPEFKDKIIHVRMKIGNSILMGSDAPPQHYQRPQGFSVSIGVTSIAESERIYKELSAGGHIIMALQKTFWSASFAMFLDRYGTPWMINCELPT